MTAYELMIKINHYLIKGVEFTAGQKANIVRRLMAVKTMPEQANRFYLGVKYPNNINSDGRQMYPIYFIPLTTTAKSIKPY